MTAVEEFIEKQDPTASMTEWRYLVLQLAKAIKQDLDNLDE